MKGCLEKGSLRPMRAIPMRAGGRACTGWAWGQRSAGSQEWEAASGTQPHGFSHTRDTHRELLVLGFHVPHGKAARAGEGRAPSRRCLLPAVGLHRPAVG